MSFAQLCEVMSENLDPQTNEPLQADNGGGRNATIVNKDLEFWTKFMSLIQIAPGAIAEVLDIDEDHVRPWQNKIHGAIEKGKQMTAEKRRMAILPTG